MNGSENQLTILIIMSVVIMLILALCLLLFFGYAQKKILKEEMEMQLLRSVHQKQLLESTIQAQEVERSRLAREIHDELGSKLGILGLNLQALLKRVNENQIEGSDLFDMQVLLNSSIETSRRISHQLMPPIFESFGLIAALKDLAVSVNKSGILQLQIEDIEELTLSSKNAELNLYRIIQELISNAVKHSKASEVVLEVERADKELVLIYRDNGVGFPEGALKEGKGLGMKNIESRLQVLSGSMELLQPEAGTEIRFNLKTQ